MPLHTLSRSRGVSSPNVAAVLSGSDPKMKGEYASEVVADVNMDEAGISCAFRMLFRAARRTARWGAWQTAPPPDWG